MSEGNRPFLRRLRVSQQAGVADQDCSPVEPNTAVMMTCSLLSSMSKCDRSTRPHDVLQTNTVRM